MVCMEFKTKKTFRGSSIMLNVSNIILKNEIKTHMILNSLTQK